MTYIFLGVGGQSLYKGRFMVKNGGGIFIREAGKKTEEGDFFGHENSKGGFSNVEVEPG